MDMTGKLVREDVRSDEEWFFYHWLLEAEQKNMVRNIEYEPMSFVLSEKVTVPVVKQLKTKTKTVDKHLFNPHIYTPDFRFDLRGAKLKPFFVQSLCNILPYKYGKYQYDKIYVDVKGGFNKFGGDRNFTVNQKWVWKDHQQYIEKIVPEKLFKKTWCPEEARFSPVRKDPVRKYIGVDNINEFLNKEKPDSD